jgi:hypothetical protein
MGVTMNEHQHHRPEDDFGHQHHRPEDELCLNHSGVCKEVESISKNLTVETADRKTEQNELWKGLNGLKGMLMAEMGSIILAMGVFILEMVFKK